MTKDLNWYKMYSEKNGYALSEHAEKIIKRIEACGGTCPCKANDTTNICPCPNHKKEIEENGHCTCNLFIKANK